MPSPEQAADRAEKLFCLEAYNCCESVATAVTEALGARCPCLPGLGTAMGGGVGHTGHVCGAVTGGAMTLGLVATTKGLTDHVAEKDWANDVAREMVEAFRERFGTARCRDLIGVDLWASDWREQYTAAGCKGRCTEFVRFSAAWVAGRLATEGR